MLRFVQKELGKSSVTKGFVRRQALKEEGEKKGETLLSAALPSRTTVAAATPQHAVCAHIPWDRVSEGNVCQNTWGSLCLGPDVGCGGHTVLPRALVPGSAGTWCWGLQLSQKPTAVKPQLLAFC